MLLRVASLALDIYVQSDYTDWSKIYDSVLDQIDDYTMMSFYFLETVPSFIIMIVLWKSNNELKYKNINLLNNNLWSEIDESLNLKSNKNRSDSNSIEKALEDNSYTEDHMGPDIDPSYFQSNNNSSHVKDNSFNHR